MDPYSAEGGIFPAAELMRYHSTNNPLLELVHIHSAFHQAQYAKAADFDTSSFSPSNQLPARVIKLRSRIALGQYDAVLKDVKGASETDLAAVALLAEYEKAKSKSGNVESVVERAKQLAEKEADNLSVELCVGTLLADSGLAEEALALLAKHQGSLDAVAVIVQIHLSQNRLDLAAKEAAGARKWAQDSLLVNVAESWVGMREVREVLGEHYAMAEVLIGFTGW